MIEFMNESSGNAIGIRASGKLTKTDYDTILIPRLTELFKTCGQLNVIFYMDDNLKAGILRRRGTTPPTASCTGPISISWPSSAAPPGSTGASSSAGS
jgi:hypothetical protein